MLSFFPQDVLDEILDFIETVSEGFLPTLAILLKGPLTPKQPTNQQSPSGSIGTVAIKWYMMKMTKFNTWNGMEEKISSCLVPLP